MSQIFYSQVDPKLQDELNARANAGSLLRETDYIAYMTEKIANVEITAYKPAPSGSKLIHGDIFDNTMAKLGGNTVRSGRYLPSGENGYLNSSQVNYKYETVTIEGTGNNLNAVLTENEALDNSRRIGPYIKVADITIGDGSMGLLNKASLSISIPNPTRDLDKFESIWMRPGRYVRLMVQHPKTATITPGLLSDLVIPDEDKLKELYPAWTDLTKLKNEIRKMRQFVFSGLITSFDFSYDADASVSVTLQLTGTSDIYTDVSMFMDPDTKTKTSKLSSYSKYENTGSAGLRDVSDPETPTNTKVELYDTLSSIVESLRSSYNAVLPPSIEYEQEIIDPETGDVLDTIKSITRPGSGIAPFIINEQTATTFNANSTDNFILFGKPYDNDLSRTFIYEPIGAVKDAESSGSIYINPVKGEKLEIEQEDIFNKLTVSRSMANPDTASISTLEARSITIDNELNALSEKYVTTRNNQIQSQKEQFEQEEKDLVELSNDNRYITVGALIHFLNNQIIRSKQGSESEVGIMCDDVQIESPYYQHLKSIDPESVLLLPANPEDQVDISVTETGEDLDISSRKTRTRSNSNWYGALGYYQDVIYNQSENAQALKDSGLFKPWLGVYDNKSSEKGKLFPSRIFINLESIKKIIDTLSQKNARRFTYGNFISSLSTLIYNATSGAVNLKLTADKNDPEQVLYADSNDIKLDEVTPYKIPMFANDPRGTIVRDFQFSAKLPSSVKNLSYVLNQGTDISTEKIAPFMNFMFNADNPETVNTIIRNYKTKHIEAILDVADAADLFGRAPQDAESQAALKSANLEYLKYPTADFRQSQQLTAPVFPIDASFTIDGINGFRYGDVLQFPGLPKKYTLNTVFSIISIVHNISSEGAWTTKVTCIMRPNIS